MISFWQTILLIWKADTLLTHWPLGTLYIPSPDLQSVLCHNHKDWREERKTWCVGVSDAFLRETSEFLVTAMFKHKLYWTWHIHNSTPTSNKSSIFNHFNAHCIVDCAVMKMMASWYCIMDARDAAVGTECLQLGKTRRWTRNKHHQNMRKQALL